VAPHGPAKLKSTEEAAVLTPKMSLRGGAVVKQVEFSCDGAGNRTPDLLIPAESLVSTLEAYEVKTRFQPFAFSNGVNLWPLLRGVPTLDKATFAFDKFFSADADDDDVYASLGRPLVRRAMGGQVGRVATFHHVIVVRQNTVHLTNLTPRGSDSPSSTYGLKHIQLMTASMFHVINLTPPGSTNPTRRGCVRVRANRKRQDAHHGRVAAPRRVGLVRRRRRGARRQGVLLLLRGAGWGCTSCEFYP
jgi:hypothetical protein